MRRRVLRLLGAVLMMSSGVVMAWPVDAGATAPSAKSWWYRPQQSGTPVAIPAPPVVPADGLYVAQGPAEENVAIAAVEYAVAGPGPSTLKLTAAPGGAGTVAVTACPVSDGFTPGVQAGPWAEAPAYNCTAGTVDGVVEGTTITFALTPEFVAAGNTAVQAILVPTPGSAPFQIPIAPPGDDSFTGPAPSQVATSDSVPVPGGSDLSSEPLGVDSGVPGLGAVDTGGAATPPVAAAQGDQPAVTRPRPRSTPVQPVAAAGSTADRLAAVVLLALLGAGLWWYGGRTASTSPALSADGPVGGIGRFARPRMGRPNRF